MHLTLGYIFQIVGLVGMSAFAALFLIGGTTNLGAGGEDFIWFWLYGALLAVGAVFAFRIIRRAASARRALDSGDAQRAAEDLPLPWVVASFFCGGLLPGIFFALAHTRLQQTLGPSLARAPSSPM